VSTLRSCPPNDAPFRADHVGSLLRPPELLKAREDFAAGPIDADERHAVEDEAIRDVVRKQEEVGLQSATDGEWLSARIEEASQFVDLDQLCLSPQCGFSSTSEGNALSYDQQWAKLRLIVETAQEVWG
jgi:methionine synthase II (cobalamin-independent)